MLTVLRLAQQLASLLAAAHRLGLAHVDLCPTAVLGSAAWPLLDFTGLWDEADRAPFLAAALGARRDAVGRWRSTLSDVECECAWQEAGHLLSALGYPP